MSTIKKLQTKNNYNCLDTCAHIRTNKYLYVYMYICISLYSYTRSNYIQLKESHKMFAWTIALRVYKQQHAALRTHMFFFSFSYMESAIWSVWWWLLFVEKQKPAITITTIESKDEMIWLKILLFLLAIPPP